MVPRAIFSRATAQAGSRARSRSSISRCSRDPAPGAGSLRTGPGRGSRSRASRRAGVVTVCVALPAAGCPIRRLTLPRTKTSSTGWTMARVRKSAACRRSAVRSRGEQRAERGQGRGGRRSRGGGRGNGHDSRSSLPVSWMKTVSRVGGSTRTRVAGRGRRRRRRGRREDRLAVIDGEHDGVAERAGVACAGHAGGQRCG